MSLRHGKGGPSYGACYERDMALLRHPTELELRQRLPQEGGDVGVFSPIVAIQVRLDDLAFGCRKLATKTLPLFGSGNSEVSSLQKDSTISDHVLSCSVLELHALLMQTVHKQLAQHFGKVWKLVRKRFCCKGPPKAYANIYSRYRQESLTQFPGQGLLCSLSSCQIQPYHT